MAEEEEEDDHFGIGLSYSASNGGGQRDMMQDGSSSSNLLQLAPALRTTKTLPTRKSVEFAIQPPSPKRLRQSIPWNAKQVVDAISTSIAQNERLEAIERAKDSFNHDVQAVHDDEMSCGADGCLFKHLTFLVYNKARLPADQQDLVMVEISMTCDTMESLYRASSEVVGSSFLRMGKDLIPLILNLIDDELARRTIAIQPKTKEASMPKSIRPTSSDSEHQQSQEATDDADKEEVSERRPITPPQYDIHSAAANPGTPEGDLMLRKATKILGHFARVGSVTNPLAHMTGFLGSIVSLLNFRPYECVPWEARLSALWTVANLACNSDNMEMMLSTPGLLRGMIDLSSRQLDRHSSLEETMEILRSRSIASRAILNLSWIQENKVIMGEDLALIDLLGDLSISRDAPFNQSRTVKEIVITTRRHAIGALRNILAAPRRVKIGLCDYKNGRLLDVLTDAALNDTDLTVKDRAFAAIHNIAIQDTAARIAKHPALVLALQNALLSEEEAQIMGEENDSPKSHAKATLLVLERSISPGSESYDNLRELLDAIDPANYVEATQREMHAMNTTAV